MSSSSLVATLGRVRRAFRLHAGGEAAPRSTLAKDDRGVIMIVGVFFTFLWIGLVWFILGVGTAINYHENLQNAADASAFAGAVYDARGMNIIAMVNVIMGVALSALVIAHMVQLVTFVLVALDCATCIPDPACGYGWEQCPTDCDTQNDVNNGVKKVDHYVHIILKVAHDVEVGLAVGWPWVAAGKSTTLVPPSKLVPVATSFSYSQIPWDMDSEVSAATGGILNLTGAGDNKMTSLKNPGRYGLPLTSDSYADLCTVAIMDMSSLYGVIPAGVSKIISGILNSAGKWFCDAGQDSSTPKDIIEGVSDIFSGACFWYNGGSPGFPSLPGDMEDVGADDHSQSPLMISHVSAGDPTSAVLAKMGTDYYGVWSTAIGNYSDNITSKRVQIAGLESKKGDKFVTKLPADVDMGVTRAEFYYDPKGSPGSPSDGMTSYETTISTSDPPAAPSHSIQNVMWNMRWRARLRRYHNFPGALGAAASLEAAINNLENLGAGGIAELALSDLLTGGGDVVGLDPEMTNVKIENNKPSKNIYH